MLMVCGGSKCRGSMHTVTRVERVAEKREGLCDMHSCTKCWKCGESSYCDDLSFEDESSRLCFEHGISLTECECKVTIRNVHIEMGHINVALDEKACNIYLGEKSLQKTDITVYAFTDCNRHVCILEILF